MALIDRVAEQRDATRSADPISAQEFGYLLGQSRGNIAKSRSGVAVSAQRALGVTAWYSGVRYIAETMAGLPCKTYRDGPNGRVQRADPSWKRKPDVEQVWFGLVESWLMSLLHRGNAYSFKLRNPAGQVVGLRFIHPDRVRPGQAADGTKVFQLDGRDDLAFTTREILHIPGLSYDGVCGLNPIQVHADGIGAIAAADQLAGTFLGKGDHTRAYLSVPQTLTNEQASQMKDQWERAHRGLTNANEFGVLGGGAEYKTIGLNPEETQLLETRKYGVAEVSRMLRLPPHKLYDLDRATFSNIEQQSIEAVVDGIRPWCTRIESWVNDDPDLTPPRNFIEFELEGLLRGDSAARSTAYQSAITGGWMTPAEVRRLENLPYIEGSDFLQRPMNFVTFGPDAGAGTAPDAGVSPDLQAVAP